VTFMQTTQYTISLIDSMGTKNVTKNIGTGWYLD
jgi:hypothetical protein